MRVYALNTIHISRRVLIDSDGMDVRTYKCGYFHTILTEMMFMCVCACVHDREIGGHYAEDKLRELASSMASTLIQLPPRNRLKQIIHMFTHDSNTIRNSRDRVLDD